MPKSYIIVAALKAETPNLEQFAPIIHILLANPVNKLAIQKLPARAIP